MIYLLIHLVIIKPFVLIIIQPLTTGVFPDNLKILKIIPIFKKGKRNILSNYRPISVLTLISKVYEKVIHMQLYRYLDKIKIIGDEQFGWIIILSHFISFYLDLSKAFDTLEHNTLLKP